ncbi:MAG: hypothetical protein WCW56_02600 [Candidatus Paceibacterota bacterium]|jgi:hypothetical protein
MNKKKIIGFLLIGLLALPPFTFAGQIPVGDMCTPEGTDRDQNCPICISGPGKNGINLRWNLQGFSSSGKINCSLHCETDQGDSCGDYSSKDSDGFLAAGTATLGPVDGVKVVYPGVGNIYQMHCSQVSPNRVVAKSSQKMTIVGCQSCRTKVASVPSKKGKILGKVVKYARMAANPTSCVISAAENVCHFKLVSTDHGVVRNFFGTAVQIAAKLALPMPADVANTLNLVAGAGEIGQAVYEACKSRVSSDGFTPKINMPNTDYVDYISSDGND